MHSEHLGIPSGEAGLAWLRGQHIGAGAALHTPYGERRLTYADWVASGRGLRFVEDYLSERVLPLYANTHTEDSAAGAHTGALSEQACAYIRARLGASAGRLMFCGNGSTAAVRRLQDILGLNVPEARRSALRLAPDERPVVFVSGYEHHSNEVSWRETLAEVVEVPLHGGRLDLGALAALLQSERYAGRPRYGSFSAASNVTGVLTDTRAVARLLHAHGAHAFFDFAASGPYVDIDMRVGAEDGYDAVFLSPHKFAGGPGTPGLLCIDPALYRLRVPTTAGGGTVRYVSRHAHAFVDDIEAREDAGTPAILGKIRTALAFAVKERIGTATLLRREAELLERARERLAAEPGGGRVEVLGPPGERLAFLSVLIHTPGGTLHPRLAVRLLNDLFGVQARGGCACAGPYGHTLLNISDAQSARYFGCIQGELEGLKPGWTRLNLAPWLTDGEADFLLDALLFLAEHGHRFVAEYRFDWQSGNWTHHAGNVPAPQLFALPRPTVPAGPPPYREYLQAACAHAARLPEHRPRPLPDGVPGELVRFMC